jgi:hypothetical protein
MCAVDKRIVVAIIMTVAGFLMEVIVQAQNVAFVRQLMPAWGDKVFNHYVALPIMAVGIITLWIRRKPTDETTPLSAGQQTNASIQSGGNVTQTAGDLHLAVHLPPYPPQQTQIARPTPTPKNEPNLQFNGWKEATIAFDNREGKWKQAEHYDRKHKAIVLKVDNSPKRDAVIRATDGLSAHLRFIGDNSDPLTISPACWYEHPWGAINMEVPSHEWLIIGARRIDQETKYTPIALGNRRLVADYSATNFFDMQIPEKGIVEVQLTEHGSVLAEQQYDYSLGQQYSLKKRETTISSTPFAELRPRIEIREIRSAGLLLSGDKHNKWVEHQNGYPAQIIVFRNKQGGVGQEAPTAEEVVARMIYTPNNKKSLEINAGCWLNETLQSVDIRPGAVAKLAVAMRLYKSGLLVALHNPRETLPVYLSPRAMIRSHVPLIEPLEIPAVPCKVEIILISKNVTLYHGTFELREGTEGALQLDPKF